MKKICGIYKITSPSKMVYIGQSIDINKRWKEYARLNCKKQQRLINSFLKYTVNKHKFEILEQCEREKLNELEKYYVDLYQSFNSKYGLNLKDGGGANGMCSEETRAKISRSRMGNKSMLGKHHSEESKLKSSLSNKGKNKGKKAWNKGIPWKEETKKKVSKSKMGTPSWNKGIPCSESAKKKISTSKIGKPSSCKGMKRSPEFIEKNRLSHLGQRAWNKGLKTKATIEITNN